MAKAPAEILRETLARVGVSESSLKRTTALGKKLRKYGVTKSAEWYRIDRLPRREWHAASDLPKLAEEMSAALRRPGGKQMLFPIQAVALLEIAENRGGIIGMRTGSGKTLVSFLAATVLDSLKPVLFVPAKLMAKTEHDLQTAREHWQISDQLQLMTYEDLSNATFSGWLDGFQPDLFVGDEAHKLKADDSARAVRAERYLDPAVDSCATVLLSGTFLQRSPKDAAKLFSWALRDRSPLPQTWKDIEEWCAATDPRHRAPMEVGALAEWATPEERCSLDGVREAVGRRITETPGVVMSTGKGVDCGLVIECKILEHPACDEHVLRLRNQEEKPDGWPAVDPPVRWMIEQELLLGFYYVLDPYPPFAWSRAYKDWSSLARELIKDRTNTIDSELQAWNACEQAAEPPAIWRAWRDIRDSFTPNQKAVWFSDLVVDYAAVWLKRNKGLCWTQFGAFGERLSERTGAPYYRENGCAADGEAIVHAARGPAICSVAACGEGLNLQDRWSRNLYVMPMANGAEHEQSLARTHRIGQREKEVTAEMLLTGYLSWRNLSYAIASERAASQLGLDDQKKLVIADKIIFEETDIVCRSGARWTPVGRR